MLCKVTFATACRPHHEDFHALGREIQDLGELFVNLAVHSDGGQVCNLDDDFLDFRLQLAQGLKDQFADRLERYRPADINPVAFLAGLAVLPFG